MSGYLVLLLEVIVWLILLTILVFFISRVITISKQLDRIEAACRRLVERPELRFELRLFESEIAQVFANRFRKFRGRLGAQFPQRITGGLIVSIFPEVS